ncbi:unnamed protein product [Parnassius mnemosyne]|uniref:Uncharacterized protein n=1 Tax=Parnassius mnemosyne TaxID=213953 RepID=A0AAV1KYN7_9NEOP
MAMKTAIVLTVMMTVALALPAQPTNDGWGWGDDGWGWGDGGWGWGGAAVNPWIPPFVVAAPWYLQWTPCAAIGSTCLDCNTKQLCTKFGGLQRACTDPTLPFCNMGECSATPTAECAIPAVNNPLKHTT